MFLNILFTITIAITQQFNSNDLTQHFTPDTINFDVYNN